MSNRYFSVVIINIQILFLKHWRANFIEPNSSLSHSGKKWWTLYERNMRNHNKLPFKYLQSRNCSKPKEKDSFMPSKSQSHYFSQRRLIGRNVTLIKCNKMSKNISCQTESCILNDRLQIQRIFLWTWRHVFALQILRVTKQAKGTRLAIVFETTKSDYQVMACNGQKPSDYSSRGKWLSPLNDDQNNKRIKKCLNYWKYSNCKLVLQLL